MLTKEQYDALKVELAKVDYKALSDLDAAVAASLLPEFGDKEPAPEQPKVDPLDVKRIRAGQVLVGESWTAGTVGVKA